MKRKWTVLEILNATIPFFKKRFIQNPRLNAERLLAYTLKIDRIGIYLQFERLLSGVEINTFRQLVHRRADGEPLQYILGETDFMGLQFHVEPGVLIPRPETEVLVTETLGLKSEFDQNSVTIWDIGTGSGCIAVSLAYHWPSCHVIASDISEKALSICERNSRLNHVEDRVQLIRHDILNNSLPANIQADIVVSNPPYVSHEELKTLDAEIVGYEPHVALTDFADGMLFYKTLLQINFNDLKCSHVLIEMSGSQTEKIKELVYDLKFKEVSLINDLNKIPRILKIRIK